MWTHQLDVTSRPPGLVTQRSQDPAPEHADGVSGEAGARKPWMVPTRKPWMAPTTPEQVERGTSDDGSWEWADTDRYLHVIIVHLLHAGTSEPH